MKQNFREPKEEIENEMFIVEDFNILFLGIDRTSRQKLPRI